MDDGLPPAPMPIMIDITEVSDRLQGVFRQFFDPLMQIKNHEIKKTAEV
jgi:hypothetical protein